MPPLRQHANVIIHKNKPKVDLIKYLHACCFSPVPSTFIKAVKNGNFITWPGLDTASIIKHLPPSVASAKGHLNQEQKNLQSTKIKIEDVDDDFFPPTSDSPETTHECCATIVEFNSKNKAYTDLTGRFPFTSSRGNKYMLIVYDYDSNAILVETLKSRQAGEIKKAWETMHLTLNSHGSSPKLYILDNEASGDLKNAMKKYKVDYQLAPPHMHRQNSAERAIQTFKNHFLAGLATADPNFPIAEWDRLIPQAVLTLNLLRNSRINPKLSAYAFLFGNFNFNKKPLAPPGTKVVVHKKTRQSRQLGLPR
jgi:hypothetical protein